VAAGTRYSTASLDKTKENHINIKKLSINKSKKNIAITKSSHNQINQRNALKAFALFKRVVIVTITKNITRKIFINVCFATNDFIIVHDNKRFVNIAFVIRKLVIVDVFFDFIRSVKIINNIKDIIRIIIVSLLLFYHDEKRARFTFNA
jgi:hypothetical protein